MTAKNGIKSKERVQQHGEVFTPDSIVNDMLDLVDNELYAAMDKEGLSEEDKARKYIENTVLEPSCGDGQFLIRILYRKLEAVKKLPVEERELAIVKAFCSIYGVDIQEDNVGDSHKRMRKLLNGIPVETFDNKKYEEVGVVGEGVRKLHVVKESNGEIKLYVKLEDLGIEISKKLNHAVDFILQANIVLGNTLITTPSLYDKDTPNDKRSVIFNAWDFKGDKVTATAKYLNDDSGDNGEGSPIEHNNLRWISNEFNYLDIAKVWEELANPNECILKGVDFNAVAIERTAEEKKTYNEISDGVDADFDWGEE